MTVCTCAIHYGKLLKKKIQSIKNFGYTIDEEFVHVMGHVHLNCSGYIVSQKKKKCYGY